MIPIPRIYIASINLDGFIENNVINAVPRITKNIVPTNFIIVICNS